jgi:tetraprenyl-beta-curcumene synthase
MTDRRPLARAGLALLLTNVRYWSTVAPLVRVQLTRWEQAARAIEDPKLQALALGKLRDERFNAQLAATLATLAPRGRRARVVEAIVALQILYDYLDVLSEQAATEPTIDGHHLLMALRDAVTLDGGHGQDSHADSGRSCYRGRPHSEDGCYLQALVDTVRTALGQLPATGAIAAVAEASAQRCAEAQMLNHDVSRSGVEQARRWATLQTSGTGLGWQELLAGASASVLAIDALIAAAAGSGTTCLDAENLGSLYLSIGALTMLDSVVDLQADIAAGRPGYVQYYDNPELMAARLQSAARDAAARARRLPHGAHHIVTLVGVVAYYTSAPSANSRLARSLTMPVRTELRPLITPILALMRAWRLAKRVRRAWPLQRPPRAGATCRDHHRRQRPLGTRAGASRATGDDRITASPLVLQLFPKRG